MKKLNLLLVLAILITFLPVTAFAETVNVGVTITGELVIDVVTTINANVTLDVANKKTTPVYMHAENHGNALVSYKIVDIAAVGVDSPSTFVAYGQTGPVEGKTWSTLTEAETKQYIAFGISKTGLGSDYVSILPDQEMALGTLNYPMLCDAECYGMGSPGAKYEISAPTYTLSINSGYMWGATTTLAYQLTTLVELTETAIPDASLASKHPQYFEGNFYFTPSSNLGEGMVSFDANDTMTMLIPKLQQGITLTEIYMHALTADSATTLLNSDIHVTGKLTSPSGVEKTVLFNSIEDVDHVALDQDLESYTTVTRYLKVFNGSELPDTDVILSEVGYYHLKVTMYVGEISDANAYSKVLTFKVVAE